MDSKDLGRIFVKRLLEALADDTPSEGVVALDKLIRSGRSIADDLAQTLGLSERPADGTPSEGIAALDKLFRAGRSLADDLAETFMQRAFSPQPTKPLLPGQDQSTYNLLLAGKVIPSAVRIGDVLSTGLSAQSVLKTLAVLVDDNHNGLFRRVSWPHGWRICPTESPTLLRVLDNNFWWRGDIWYRYKNTDTNDSHQEQTDLECEIFLCINRRYDRRVFSNGDYSSIKIIDGASREELTDPVTGKPLFQCRDFPSSDHAHRDRLLAEASARLETVCGDWRNSYVTVPWWPDTFTLLRHLLRQQTDPGILRHLFQQWQNG